MTPYQWEVHRRFNRPYFAEPAVQCDENNAACGNMKNVVKKYSFYNPVFGQTNQVYSSTTGEKHSNLIDSNCPFDDMIEVQNSNCPDAKRTDISDDEKGTLCCTWAKSQAVLNEYNKQVSDGTTKATLNDWLGSNEGKVATSLVTTIAEDLLLGKKSTTTTPTDTGKTAGSGNNVIPPKTGLPFNMKPLTFGVVAVVSVGLIITTVVLLSKGGKKTVTKTATSAVAA